MEDSLIFHPQYFKDFSCIGDKCASDCCHGWEINIDKATYDKYMTLEENGKGKYSDKITVMSTEPFAANFNMREDGTCIFLGEDKLCAIQKEYGHDHLSVACRNYPRLYFLVGREIEAFLSMSCETAAKAAMFNKKIMRFEESPIEPDKLIAFRDMLKPGEYTNSENGINIFWRLRTVSLYIIQSRKYLLWVRVVILGLFAKKMSECLPDGENELYSLADEFESRIDRGFYDSLEKQFEESDRDREVKAQLINEIIRVVENNADVKKYISHLKSGLGLTDSGYSAETVLAGYESAFNTHYKRYFKDREYILENYIVNTLLMNGFPFCYGMKTNNVLDNFILLACKYAVVKYALVGLCGYHKKRFNDKLTAECVASFSRIFEHNKQFLEDMIDFLKNSNAATVGAIYMLVRE